MSPGCEHCYALTMAARLKAMGSGKYQRDGDARTSGPGFGITVHDDALALPLRWRSPRIVFVNSMSDLWHPEVPDEFIARVFAVMASTSRHSYQLLTKRPQRMAELLATSAFVELVRRVNLPGRDLDTECAHDGWPLPNVWIGTSIESDRYTWRARRLTSTPAAIRFLSLEPLLGPVPALDLTGIDWVIVGGESGASARPLDIGWVREIRDHCTNAGVAFFFKQWGGRTPKAQGRYLDGRTWDEMPVQASQAAGGMTVSSGYA